MAKPTVIPRWANVGGSIVTPPSGKLDVGWLAGEKPPAQYENWKGYYTFKWIEWIDSIFGSSGNNLTLPGTIACDTLTANLLRSGELEPYYIPASAAKSDGGTLVYDGLKHTLSGTQWLQFPSPTSFNQKLRTFGVLVNKASNATITITVSLCQIDSAGAVQVLDTVTNAVNAPGMVTVQKTYSTPGVYPPNNGPTFVRVNMSSGSGDFAYWAFVAVNRAA